MKFLLIGTVVLFFTGCSTQTVVETVRVDVPVPVSCVNPTDVPLKVPSAAESITVSSAPGEKIKAVLIERERLRQSDTEFRALVQGCFL